MDVKLTQSYKYRMDQDNLHPMFIYVICAVKITYTEYIKYKT